MPEKVTADAEFQQLNRPSVNDRPSVRVVPAQPHCFAFGGFELQMIAAMDTARAAGSHIQPLDFWKREADFDVLHVWGLELQHIQTVKWTHAAGKKTVLSALVGYPGFRSRLRHIASSYVGPMRLKRPMLVEIDRVTVVNSEQARYVNVTIGFPSEKTVVIPNVVEDIFFDRPVTDEPLASEQGYVLCVGNICRRKNQLALISACREVGVPVLLIGTVLTGEEEYGRAVEHSLQSSLGGKWVRGLAPGSLELARAYRGASAFALLSHNEQQPISALEAAACGKPLVLGNLPYAKQEFYEGAALANLSSLRDMATAVRSALNRPDAHCPAPHILERCRRPVIGAAYTAVYKSLASDIQQGR